MDAGLASTLKRIALISAGSFVFAFSLVPLGLSDTEEAVAVQAELPL